MNLEQLAAFVDVYRAGGFAPVAKERAVAPSSVSRAIAALEGQLEVRLFQRTTRRLQPTEAGEAFFRRIAPLIEEIDAARAELADRAGRPTGRLRVTASVSFGQICIVPLLAAFRERYPQVELELILSDAALDLVGERIDVAVRHGALADSSMIARRLAAVRYRVVASPKYLKHASTIGRPADLQSHPCIAFSYEGFRSQWRFRRNGAVETVEIAPAITVSNAAAIRDCALSGLGPALLADWTVAADLAAGRLVDVFPGYRAAGATFESAVWLVFPSRTYIPAKARAFADFLVDSMA